MSVITATAHNLRVELHARGILSFGRTDCEAIIAAVVTTRPNWRRLSRGNSDRAAD
jgi:hypothetical protein